MQKNSQDFSIEEALEMAKSPAGQQLLAMLQRSDRTQLERIARQAAAGDYETAARQLNELLGRSGG